jgi:hypothetical protein
MLSKLDRWEGVHDPLKRRRKSILTWILVIYASQHEYDLNGKLYILRFMIAN